MNTISFTIEKWRLQSMNRLDFYANEPSADFFGCHSVHLSFFYDGIFADSKTLAELTSVYQKWRNHATVLVETMGSFKELVVKVENLPDYLVDKLKVQPAFRPAYSI